MTTFAKNLRYLIEKNKINNSELASLLGISNQTINLWLKGGNPKKPSAIKLSYLFDVSQDDLFKKDLTLGDHIPLSNNQKRSVVDHEQFTLRFSPDVKKELKRRAVLENITMTHLIEREMMKYVMMKDKKARLFGTPTKRKKRAKAVPNPAPISAPKTEPIKELEKTPSPIDQLELRPFESNPAMNAYLGGINLKFDEESQPSIEVSQKKPGFFSRLFGSH